MSAANRAIAALAACALLFAASAAAQAPGPRASLPDIEDEVMCPICGTLLELSEAPQAARQRAFIRRLIGAGRSKEQIKDALVAEYGGAVLATPQDSGFQLSAWLVPLAAFVIAAAGLIVAVRRWRRTADRGSDDEAPAPPGGEEAQRLDSDLARYDL